jgi:hypothetical protein
MYRIWLRHVLDGDHFQRGDTIRNDARIIGCQDGRWMELVWIVSSSRLWSIVLFIKLHVLWLQKNILALPYQRQNQNSFQPAVIF